MGHKKKTDKENGSVATMEAPTQTELVLAGTFSPFSLLSMKKQKFLHALNKVYPQINYALDEENVQFYCYEQWMKDDQTFRECVQMMERAGGLDLVNKEWSVAKTEGPVGSSSRRFLLPFIFPEKYGSKPIVQVNNFDLSEDSKAALRQIGEQIRSEKSFTIEVEADVETDEAEQKAD